MEQYLQRTQLAGVFNRIGAATFIFGLSFMWFIYLWGLQPTALVAGAAFGFLLLLLLRLFNKRTVDIRQMQLRRRIGGEMAVNKLLLLNPGQAHFEVILWLSMAYPLQMEKGTEEGFIALHKNKRLFISAICRHDSEKITCSDLIRIQKASIACGADKAVACITAALNDAAKRYIETATPPVSVIDRKALARLAGIMQPATNEQLVALGQSKKRRGSKRMWAAHILDASRSKRYLLYGLGLMLLYFLTKLKYYPVPGAALICLAILSKCYPRNEASL
jgi:hypothetical protein